MFRRSDVDGAPRRRAPSQLAFWLIGLTVLAVGGAVIEYVARDASVVAANVGWTASSLVAVVGVAAAVRHSAGRARHGWLVLLAGSVAWLLGQGFWILYTLVGYPASPNLADLCWLAFAVLSALAVMRMGVAAQGQRISGWEVAPLMVAVCALLTALLWEDITSASLSTPSEITVLAYPVLYVTAALIMLQSVVTGVLDLRRNRGMALLLVGLAVDGLAFILWSPLLLRATYVVGTQALDALWTLGMLLVGIGACSAGAPTAVADVEHVSRRRGATLPAATFVILAAAQAALVLSDAAKGAEFSLTVGMTAVGATLIARATAQRREQTALLARLREREAELEQANTRLSEESRRDPLTGLGNRLSLREDLLERGPTGPRSAGYCLVLCDLDRFKDYNDALGHQAGDDALRDVARLLEDHTRAGDRVYRYGGEELLLILHGADEQAGAAIAERHRRNLERAVLPHPGNPPTGVLTFSAGVAAAQPEETAAQVLRRADAALYRAKAQGRNQVAVAERADQSAAMTAGSVRISRSEVTDRR